MTGVMQAQLLQAVLLVLGAIGMFLLVQANSAPKRIVAYVVLLVGQPFWIGVTLGAGQWGMLALSIAYACLFAHGIVKARREMAL